MMKKGILLSCVSKTKHVEVVRLEAQTCQAPLVVQPPETFLVILYCSHNLDHLNVYVTP
jgi:hypothetical protein